MIIDKVKAKEILVGELGYKPYEADIYLKDYPELFGELAPAVEKWFEDRTISDVSVKGVSIKDLMRIHKCHFLMAVSELNPLFKPDMTEEKKTEYARIIQKPHILYDKP
jgi:serine kinase of HPr protein (carbohydrate metabolism regulator)